MLDHYRIGAAFLILLACCSSCEQVRAPDRILIPEGQHGWFQICYLRSGAPPLELHDGRFLIDFSRGREMRTESEMTEGWAADEYFFVSATGRLSPIASWPKTDGVVVRNKTLVNRGQGWCSELFVGDLAELTASENPWSKSGGSK